MLWHRLLLLACAFTAAAHADDADLSLDEAVRKALDLAPQVQAQAANVESMQSRAISAGRLPDPELILGIDNLPVTGPDAYSTTGDFMTMRKVGVMQSFPSATRRKLERERAEVQANVADAEFTETQLNVSREVAQAWMRRWSAEQSLTELKALEPELMLQSAASRAAVSAGRGSTADALAADATLGVLHNRVLRMSSEVRQAAYELARWIDEDANRPLASAPDTRQLPTDPEALRADIREHGSLLPFESQIEAARLDVALAKAQRRPDWSASLAFSKRAPGLSDMVSVEFRIGLPLFTRNRQNPLVRAKQAELRQLEAQREEELRMHSAELAQIITQWQQLSAQLEQYDSELLPLARDRSHAALASYRAGSGELRSALDAYSQEIEFLIERAQLRYEQGRSWAFLRYLGPEHLHQ